MHYGFVLPITDIHIAPELTVEAERAGWDGVFISDCISIETEHYSAAPNFDPWIVLAMMASRTQRVRLGTMLSPISRRRPWKLARELVTLDHLSNGRIILAVGLGAAEDDAGFCKVGEEMSMKGRAELLDESLDILDMAWSGMPIYYEGKHYQVHGMTLLPRPVQTPRIPVWVVGAWPRMKSMRRVLHWDGLLPTKKDGSDNPMAFDDISAMKAFIDEHHTSTASFDIVWEGETPGEDRAQSIAIVHPWIDAGITWWLESRWGDVPLEDVRKRIQQGPPRP